MKQNATVTNAAELGRKRHPEMAAERHPQSVTQKRPPKWPLDSPPQKSPHNPTHENPTPGQTRIRPQPETDQPKRESTKGKMVSMENHLIARSVLLDSLSRQGISTAREFPYKRPYYLSVCQLIHQDAPHPRRARGSSVPLCHPKFGRSPADNALSVCTAIKCLPKSGDHIDAWWTGDRLTAAVWYPYDHHTPSQHVREVAESLGLAITVEPLWGLHNYGATTAVIIALSSTTLPTPPSRATVLAALPSDYRSEFWEADAQSRTLNCRNKNKQDPTHDKP